MKTPPTLLPFACVVLALAGIAFGNGAWQSVRETLNAPSQQRDAVEAASEARATPARPLAIARPDTMPIAPVRQETEPSPPQDADARSGNLLFDRERLLAAKQALLAMPELEGRDVRVFDSIHAYDDGRINLKLLDPRQPGNMDEYNFKDGAWRKGAAVNPRHLPRMINPASDNAPLQRIDFEGFYRVATALQEQRKALSAEPGQVDHLYLLIRRGGRLRWLPDDVDGDRTSVRVVFDAQGYAQGVQPL
ncbi:hypothetical protein [Xanthomonas medicagonis]|uniref:hypothetical protein n=1 Tax=Xanthomonas medicagonis TaxID=3160841 RepID=UPI0035162846